MRKSLIVLFTGHSYIVATDGPKFYYSTNRENHEFTEIDKEVYEENFQSCLVIKILNI